MSLCLKMKHLNLVLQLLSSPNTSLLNPGNGLTNSQLLVQDRVLLRGPAEAWNSTGGTGALASTFRDTTAWLRRSKRVREPPWQYRTGALLLSLDVDTE